MSVVRALTRTLGARVKTSPFSVHARFLSVTHAGAPVDLSHMWTVGSFPVVDMPVPSVFDTTGMLSSLPDPFPMYGYPTVPELIIDGLDSADNAMHADSVLRKRRKKMNKHKHKKRKKALRNRTKKN
ncbi:hypothetical protein H310_12798 [Aphanomyces invadans]|uniref:Small ribosomal subunit protein mS38 n=1 Tax=Aphanomyces invadans TaxID=157072 RepID=A0A024TIK9_9STRA|nr:hypothetical protein H310_12798 [Aphanomyces invadans]ETV93197.1 hypothetical protein H310_12798 [Aphanomyces invadans]RHY30204.1 hypothetical protein DYB32_004541 [Aphanomyces invadans]|eukprot:XP_008878219.1 hypothetical protein H310_12798 [Aphanomyces invadans]